MKMLEMLKKLLSRMSLSQQAVHYLCGAEALPHPLTA